MKADDLRAEYDAAYAAWEKCAEEADRLAACALTERERQEKLRVYRDKLWDAYQAHVEVPRG